MLIGNKGLFTKEFFLNGKRSSNSVNSANSGDLINHRGMIKSVTCVLLALW